MRFAYLSSALAASLVAGVFLLAGREIAIQLEHRTIRATAPEVFALKNQGTAFQRVSAETPDILLLFGSSELTMGPPSVRAGNFFRTEPSGFQVSPVGKPGATSLVILQKLAALGPELKGRKVAISLSPSWFLVPVVEPYMYKGNFSLFAAGQMVFGDALDFQLKQDVASRMLEFPRTLDPSPLLEFAVRHLASGKWSDRVAFAMAWPLGELQNAVLDLQDHFESMIYILTEAKQPQPAHPRTFDWASMIRRAARRNSAREDDKAESVELELLPRGGDADFLARIATAKEWTDLEMLLRVLRELQAKPLLLTMPLDGSFYDDAGISAKARDAYYAKIRSFAARYDFPIIEFQDHDRDPDFLDEHHYHFTEKGWLYCDRALADFFSQTR
jgi:D-alanine transfer protein